MKTYKGDIESLNYNQIFVFGSNTEGRHGKGAALIARQKFGAIYGQARGLQGHSYAIVTKDLTKNSHPSITQKEIKEQIQELYSFAEICQLEYLVAYKGNSTTLNGYTIKQMAKLFACDGWIPDNIVFEEEFAKLVSESLKNETIN